MKTGRIFGFLVGIIGTALQAAVVYNSNGGDWTGKCKGDSKSKQSPIDIQDIKGACDNTIMLDLTLPDKNVTMKVKKLVEEGLLEGGTFMDEKAKTDDTFGTMYATGINGKIYGYDTTRIIWHAPSEHTIDSVQYDAEMQIEMTLKPEFGDKITRNKAVLSILFTNTQTATTSAFLKFFEKEADKVVVNFNASLSFILPNPLVYFAYEGSKTQPDCTEVVNWYVVQTPAQISSAQLKIFNDLWKLNTGFAGGKGNNREIQPLNGRIVKKGGVVCQEQFIYFFSFVLLYAFINYFIFKLL